jgi:TRAP-type C4-dicarboxylate transport system permease small subunit
MRPADKLISLFDHTIQVMRIMAGILLVLVTVGVSVGVVSRYFFNRPIGWLVELSSYALLYITFMVAAWVLREEGHVSMDFVINRLSPRVQFLVQAMTSAVSALVCLILTCFGVVVAWDLLKTNYFTPTMLELPKWVIIAVIFVGSFLLSIEFIGRSIRFFREWKTPSQ